MSEFNIPDLTIPDLTIPDPYPDQQPVCWKREHVRWAALIREEELELKYFLPKCLTSFPGLFPQYPAIAGWPGANGGQGAGEPYQLDFRLEPKKEEKLPKTESPSLLSL